MMIKIYFSEEGNVIKTDNCTNFGSITGQSYTCGIIGFAKNITVLECTNHCHVEVGSDLSNNTIGELYGMYSYTIRFDANGGTVTPNLDLTFNGKLTTLPIPSKDKAEFVGWYLDETPITIDYVFTKPTTITPKWKDTVVMDDVNVVVKQ